MERLGNRRTRINLQGVIASAALLGLLLTGGTATAIAAVDPVPDATATQAADPPAPDPVVPDPVPADPGPPVDPGPPANPGPPAPTDPAPSAPAPTAPVAPSGPPAPADPAPADPAPTDAGLQSITPALVPVPSTTESVITVKVGGYRTSPTTVSGLAGVTLRLFDGNASGPNANPRTEPWATCVSDAAGDCNFVVPNTGSGGANRDLRFWIKQAGAAPSGYFSNTTLAVGGTTVSTPYQFRTGNQLRGGQTYTSTSNFMISSGSSTTASGGIWQVSQTNAPPPPQCGIDVALVIDLSGSVAGEITNLRAAASSFVDALTGTPSAVALYTFASNAPASGGANLGITPVSTAAGAQTVKNRIATYTAAGYTNWDRGLYQVASSSTQYDLAVVITDGNPTVYGNVEGPGTSTRFREVENGIFSANAISQKGTRIVAVGVGDGVTGAPDNLRAISGPVANSDYYQTGDYSIAASRLRELALGSCNGSVSVVKQVVPSGTTGETITGAQPAGGWNFTATSGTAGVTPASQSGVTEAGTGAVNFPLTYPGGTTTASMTIAETAQPGYTLVTQGGNRAVCRSVSTGAAVAVTNDPVNPLGFRVAVPKEEAVSCTVYNRAQVVQSAVSVDKQWVVNGETYADGNQPVGISAALQLGGTAQSWGVSRTGLTAGSTISIAETTDLSGRELCTVTSSRITQYNGGAVDLPVPSSVTLAAGNNAYTVTNTVNCTASLTLAKQVQGGSADPSSWTLDAVAPDGTLAGPEGTTGVTADVTPNRRYPLVESGNPLYVQTIRPGGAPVLPSLGSWQCEQVDVNGTVIPGFNDGINGGVTVPLGYRVRCTALNQTARLTLIKQVVNDDGGTNVPSDWTLTATPQGTPPAGVVAQNVAGSAAGAAIEVRPGTTYALSESGPGGYEQTSMRCTTGPGGAYVDATQVTLAALDEVTCVVVNDDRPARLTLVKVVDNGASGATGVAADWTLSAAGPTPMSGVSGAVAVTAAEVNVGTYTLSESGPAGYTGSAWVCTGGTLTGDSLVLAGGDDVTCTVTNTAVAPQLTLVKVVDNGESGATAAGSEWTLTAAGPVTITGATGATAVTSAAVQVGTYDLSESGPGGYEASDWVCTGAVSSTESSVTLGLGSQVTCTVTNSALTPRLTLVKEVVNDNGGTRTVDDFPVTATGSSVVTGTSGTAAVTDVAVQIGDYALTESNPDPLGYELTSLVCTDGGTPLPVSVAAANLNITLGMNVTCTFTNNDRPALLTLLKGVDPGTSGSAATPADWTLSADPVNLTGQGLVSGTGGGGLTGVSGVSVMAGTYLLGESGPAGFDAGDWVCQGAVVTGNEVVIPNGGDVVCTITNTAITPLLTLTKAVEQGTAASVDPANSWTLTADGPTPITGRTGEAAVTAAPVRVGVYDLSEAGGPVGYTASDWVCTGGSLTGSLLTVAEGDDIECTITNTAQPAQWTVAKTSNPPSGSTVTAGDVVTYTVTVVHTGGVAPVGATVVDSLVGVLDDATLGATITASVGSASLVGTDLVWDIGTFTGTQTVTYSVTIGENDGAVIRNLVTPPPGATCAGSCETVHTTAQWDISKTADPVSGTTVKQGDVITYTLTAVNSGAIPVSDAVAVDDLTDVLDDASLVEPLDPALSFDGGANTLTWTIPALAVDGPAVTVSYSVRVNDDAFDTTLRNVVTATGPGGRCMPPAQEGDTPCTTQHRAGLFDVAIAKSHVPLPEGAVDANKGDVVEYILTVTNTGVDPITNISLLDELAPSLTIDPASIVLPAGWTSTGPGSLLDLVFGGELLPGDSVEVRYQAAVGDVPRVTPTGAFLPVDNTACLTLDRDADPTNNCATDRVPVKAVAIDVAAVCVRDTPIVTYNVTPTNVPQVPSIALIWWTVDAFAAHDPSIDAADTAAILADGAAKVDTIEVPAGWVPGDAISGQLLWPGAAVDSAGEPIAWPGWTQEADGTWILDPAAPFYDLRGETVVEVRINPTTDAVLSYPPATPNCAAVPPTGGDTPPNQSGPIVTPSPGIPVTTVAQRASVPPARSSALPRTGSDAAGLTLISVALMAGGLALVARRRIFFSRS